MIDPKDRQIQKLERKLKNSKASLVANEKHPWKSKKLWASIIAALVTVANKVFDLGLDPVELAGVVGPLIAYVVGQGLADLGKNKKNA